MSHLVIQPARSLSGSLTLPGDKSISHRAVLIAGISRGSSRISHCLKSGDLETTRRALHNLGTIIREESGSLVVVGRPDRTLKPPSIALDMGNSGTTTRLLLGILAGHPFQATLTGDASLSKRPMRRVTEPLEKMGAVFHGAGGADRLPLTIQGGTLRGIRYTMPVPSAQVKSSLLLAGLYAEGPTTVHEPVPTRDHTERMLTFFGAHLVRSDLEATLHPGAGLEARELFIPGDLSSAAFFLVAAMIVPDSSVTVRGVGLNPTRTGPLEILKQMNGALRVVPDATEKWEPIGDVTATFSSLRAVRIGAERVPGLIDELPIMMVAATQAQGMTTIEGAGELRVKETDRIRSMVTGLSAMGARIRAEGESIEIEGPVKLTGAHVDSFGDHRTAMALAVGALAASGETVIEGAQWIGISFPGFTEALTAIRR